MTNFTNDPVVLRSIPHKLNPEEILKGMDIQAGGYGYTQNPTVTIDPPGVGGTQAYATASIHGPITGIFISSGGGGYTEHATVAFNPTSADINVTPILGTGGQILAIKIINGGTFDTPPAVSINNNGYGGAGAVLQATMSVQKIELTDPGSGYPENSDPSVTIALPTGPESTRIRATAYAKRKIDGSLDVVLGTFPKGNSYLTFSDNVVNPATSDWFMVKMDPSGDPITVTNKGVMIEKDLLVGGFLDSWQGAIWLNYGLRGMPKLSTPPYIGLMQSSTAYPGGASGQVLPSNPEQGQLFNHNGTYKMWEGTRWVTGNFTGLYDTLFITKSDGVTPAHLNIGYLTLSDRKYHPKIILGGSDYQEEQSPYAYHDNLFLVKANGSTPAHLNVGTVFAEQLYARGYEGATKGAHLSCHGENDFHLSTYASNSTPYWKIGLGDGAGGFNSNMIYLASEGNTISVYNGNFRVVNENFKIQANDYYDSSAGASATFHGNLTGTAAKIRVLASNPSPADGEIWLVSS